MLEIGKLKLKSKFILSPMSGVSDLPFRLLNRKFGCELAFVEMINCRSISHKSRRTQEMISTSPEDKPLGIQILGCEAGFVAKALDVISGYDFDLLDFNAACPAKKVVNRGEGASLLKEPKKLHKLLKLVVENSGLPVTVKIRTGWDKNLINARDIALLAEDAGVRGLFIHGRTKLQGYSGSVDYRVIGEVKKALQIPVIASGDIFSAPLIRKMFDETGCDGIAIARGSLGNPWIFRQAEEFLNTGRIPEKPAINEIAGIMAGHLKASVDFYGERVGVVRFRKFFIWYTKGLRKIRPLRDKVSAAKTQGAVTNIIKACLRDGP